MSTKDLVDMVLMIETAGVTADQLAGPIKATFLRRKSHKMPLALPEPPTIWKREFAALAVEAQLLASTIEPAFQTLAAFWSQIRF